MQGLFCKAVKRGALCGKTGGRVLRVEMRPKLQQKSHEQTRGRQIAGWEQGSQDFLRRVSNEWHGRFLKAK